MKSTIFVIIGFNSSSYGLARILHNTYGIKPFVFGDELETSPIRFSSIVHCIPVKNFRDKDVFSFVLVDFVQEKDKKYILLSGNELNLYHIESNYDLLSKYYCIPYPKPLLNDSYFDKHLAMKVCQEANIPYPHTLFLTLKNNDTFTTNSLDYPVILKPSVSAHYKTVEFNGKAKNYLIDDDHHLTTIIKKIRDAGYQSSLVVQEIIPSAQYNEYSVNGYMDLHGHLRAVSFGRALIGWPNAKRRGNHLVIVSVTNQEQEILLDLTKKFFSFHSYYGLFNIDFIQNSESQQMFFIEFNPRQGRSHFYTEMSGVSLVQAIVDDIIDNKPFVTTTLPCHPFVWLDASLDSILNQLSNFHRDRLNLDIKSNNIDFTWTYPFDFNNSIEFKEHVMIKIANMDKLLSD